MQRTEHLHAGKAKSVYATDDADKVIIVFRDDTSAFDGQKVEKLAEKGRVNNYFNAHIMNYLDSNGVATHFIERYSETESVFKKMDMIPVECVVRNVVAGSLTKRLGIEEGTPAKQPIFEFFLKDDDLHDPMINIDHIREFGWASEEEAQFLQQTTLRVNALLQPLFEKGGIVLVDFKLEFGRYKGELLLADEISPDGCRLWDKSSGEKMDKDRFRRDLGNVVENYKEVASRIGLHID